MLIDLARLWPRVGTASFYGQPDLELGSVILDSYADELLNVLELQLICGLCEKFSHANSGPGETRRPVLPGSPCPEGPVQIQYETLICDVNRIPAMLVSEDPGRTVEVQVGDHGHYD